jgi:hypothetical protein
MAVQFWESDETRPEQFLTCIKIPVERLASASPSRGGDMPFNVSANADGHEGYEVDPFECGIESRIHTQWRAVFRRMEPAHGSPMPPDFTEAVFRPRPVWSAV